MSEEDLHRAGNRALTSIYAGWEELEQRADALNQLAVFRGDPRLLADEPRRYAEVTSDDVRTVADEVFRREGSVAVAVVPEEAA